MPVHIEDYTVGWICAIDLEYAVVCESLDEEYTRDDAPRLGSQDDNIYTFGRIHQHNVVISCLPKGRYGTTSAALLAQRMHSSFPTLRFTLMVGIAGGAPSQNIRLGDVVVSSPTPRYGGVIQYDFGKAIQEHEFEETGHLAAPPEILLNALSKIKAEHKRRGHRIPEIVNGWLQKNPRLKAEYSRPNSWFDRLYKSSYVHSGQEMCDCQITERESTAELCDSLVSREDREAEDDGLHIHYGLIASANQLMKDAIARDSLSRKYNVLCFEMEAAGLMNNFPCLVIRGICDYSDTHKNDGWQGYAAAIAAAYAKELLSVISGTQVGQVPQPGSSMSDTAGRAPSKNEITADAIESLAISKSSENTAKCKYEKENVLTEIYHADTSSKAPLSSMTPSYMIPSLQNRRFVGREEKLAELEQNFTNGEARKLAIYGLGGIGKTQLALAFCYKVKAQYPDCSIFWLSTISGPRFEQDYIKLARACSLSVEGSYIDLVARVKDHLRRTSAGRWLMVVDNVDDKAVVFDDTGIDSGVVDKLPESENGFTLFTTRYKDIAVDLTDNNTINLGEMTLIEAQLFLAKYLGNRHFENAEVIEHFLQKLTYLPLAIAQASSYIAKASITIAKYLTLLESTEDELRLLDRDFRDSTREKGSENAVALTWFVSFKQIQEEDPGAANILFFLACVENKAIPLFILPSLQSNEDQTHALGTLVGYSFLSKQGEDEIYDMHRLVHLAVKKWLRTEAIDNEHRAKAITHLANKFSRNEWKNRNMWRDYLPHALKVLQNTVEAPSHDRADLCINLSVSLQQDGRYSESVEWLSQCVSWRDQTLPEGDVKRINAQAALAFSYSRIGEYEASLIISERAATVGERTLAEDHPSLLQSQQSLAFAYLTNGRSKEGIQLLEKLLARAEKLPGGGHRESLTAKVGLATAYLADGQTKKAISMLEEVIPLFKMETEGHFPDILAPQYLLAEAYDSDGRPEAAVELLENALEAAKRAHAENYDTLWQIQYKLALLHEQQGYSGKATRLLEVVREALPADNHMRRMYEMELENIKSRSSSTASTS